MTAPHDLDVLSTDELAELLRGAPWRRVAVLHDGDLPWVGRVVGALHAAVGEGEVLDPGRLDALAEALAFRPDLAIAAVGDGDAPRLEAVVRPLRRIGTDVVIVQLTEGAARATREVAAQHGAVLVRARDPELAASETVRCLAAALATRVGVAA